MTRYEAYDHFARLGAVKYGSHVLSKERYNGEPKTVVFDDIVYFFDDQDREIGYWTVLCDVGGHGHDPFVFAPDYRTWGKEIFDNLRMCTLHPPLPATGVPNEAAPG